MPIRSRSPLLTGPLALAVTLGLAAPVFAGELHEVTPGPGKAAVGAPGKATLTLAAKNGWHLNAEAPITVKLAPAAGVTVDKSKLTRKDLAESTQDRARFDIGFQGAEAGAKSIECEASFVICQDAACKPVKETVTLKVDVTAAAKKK